MKQTTKRIAAALLAVWMLLGTALTASAADVKKYDFSEQNIATHCAGTMDRDGFDGGPDDGGNAFMAAAYLARWTGPVLEKDDPFPRSGYPRDLKYVKASPA